MTNDTWPPCPSCTNYALEGAHVFNCEFWSPPKPESPVYNILYTACDRCGECNAHLTADCPELSSPDLIDLDPMVDLILIS